jgi:hypothetical protein
LKEDDIKLKWRDFEALETKQLHLLRPIIARYMVDDNGNRIPEAKANDMLLDLDFDQMNKVSDAFIKFITDSALNPQTAAS